jgi:outer membrane protein assembly factor BamA
VDLSVAWSVATQAQPPQAAQPSRSPWLVVPIISSNPKLGTSLGGLVGYLRNFDPQSRVSLFAAGFAYTTTESKIGVLIARTSSGQDHHRVVALAAFGKVKNDYDDYLGTGQSLKTDSNLYAVVGRYVYRVAGSWLVGAQGSSANYQVFGASAADDAVLETLGVRGFKSTGLGLVVMRDSRDNEDMPTRGWFMNANSLAYREALGGDESYDVYRLDGRGFVRHGGKHVFAVRQNNQFTSGAPVAAEATVILRGYKLGQYLGKYMSSLEAEERVRIAGRIGATFFAGAAYLYGGDTPGSASERLYPSYGLGVHYVIKPEQNMLVNLEYAHGNAENWGLYMKLGYSW